MNYPELAAPWDCKVTARVLAAAGVDPKNY